MVPVSSATNGPPILDSHIIGRATHEAMVSGRVSAMFFGTSSPMTSDRKAMTATTVPSAMPFGVGRQLGHHRRDLDRQLLGNRGAAIGAGQDADQRDPDLHRGEELRGMVRQLQRRRGPLVAIVGALLKADLAGGDHRHLGHREDGVGEDQQQDEEDFGSDGQFYDEPTGRRSIGQTRRSRLPGEPSGGGIVQACVHHAHPDPRPQVLWQPHRRGRPVPDGPPGRSTRPAGAERRRQEHHREPGRRSARSPIAARSRSTGWARPARLASGPASAWRRRRWRYTTC